MENKKINLVAVAGFVLLGVAVIVGIFVGVLFTYPKMSFLGAKAVNERDTEIIYFDEDLADAFSNGKFILESYGTKVNVKMSNKNYRWENTIVVHETATGIAFNSMSRTLVEWTKTKYGKDNEVYYRIKVLEPRGMVFKYSPTTVTINLPYRTDDFKYDFILQSNYSNVEFGYTDSTFSDDDKLLIDDLVVESAGKVEIPYNKYNSVENITIKGNNTKLNCNAEVRNNVIIEGDSNTVKIGSEVIGVNGNLTVAGENNQVTVSSADKVNFVAKKGKLNITNFASSLNVQTVAATVDVAKIFGSVVMNTKSGSLSAGLIGEDLEFYAGTSENPNATANLNVNSVSGNSLVRNFGVGLIDLSNVDGDVDITSALANGGNIDVNFAQNASSHDVKIIGYDGDINVSNINGGTIKILAYGELRGGYANVKTSFKQVGNVNIDTTADTQGSWRGDIKISLVEGCNPVNLYIFGASSADKNGESGVLNVGVKDNEVSGLNALIGTGTETGRIEVNTWHNVEVFTDC